MNRFFPTPEEWKRGIRYAVVFLTIAFCVWKAEALLAGLIPFLLAFGISVAIEPLVRTLNTHLHLGRGWSAFVVIVALLLGGWWIVSWATISLISATAGFLDDFPQYRETIVGFVQQLTEQGTRVFAALPAEVSDWITENTSRLAEGVEQLLTTVAWSLLGVLRTVPGILTAGLLIPLATFFISKDLPKVQALLWSLIPEEEQGRVGSVMQDLWGAAWKYLRAAAILVSITTSIATIGFIIVGVENWFAAGIVVGVLDFLPVLGPTVFFIPWIAYLIIVDNLSLAISLSIVYGLAVGTRSLIEAKVIGDSIGIHPLAILIAMYLGALIMGLKGAILGPALLFVSKAIYKAWKAVETPS